MQIQHLLLMKRALYILAFAASGVLAQFLAHGLIEIWYGELLLRDFPKYSLGLSWRQWILIHHIGTVILLTIGMALGFYAGVIGWRKLSEKQQDAYKSKPENRS